MAPFEQHLRQLGDCARNEAEFARDAELAARALGGVMAGQFGYEGDRAHYDDPLNADLMSVIQRRRGLPVALGILYMHAARAAGMAAQGLSAPGHFLLMVGIKGGEAVVDPFNGGAAVDRERLRAPPRMAEVGLPDEPSALEPVSDTEVLLRLQNNIKTRALAERNVGRAVEVLRRMLLIAPRRAPLWLELARLQETVGALGSARAAYEQCLVHGKETDYGGNEAALALQALKRRLN
jgi:regulator of sirC expression with transglutaminase-like and TPR domain